MHTAFVHTANEIVGLRLRMLREQRGLTQQQLADLLEVDRQYVWKLENGMKNITLDYLDRIAKALSVGQSAFLNTETCSR